MAVTNFVITLMPPQQVYYPGQAVSGIVDVKLNTAIERNDLILQLIGKSQCRFKGRTGQHGRGHDAHTRVYSKDYLMVYHQKFFSNLEVGNHEFEFNFSLPTCIPSSLETPLGNIRYELKADIGDFTVVTIINVNDVIDTNVVGYSVENAEESYQVSWLGRAVGSLAVKATLDRNCYCPGEAILISTTVENNTSRNMNALKAKLIQIIKYKTDKRTKMIENVIAKLKGPKVKKGDSYTWEKQPFGIPAVPPTISNDAVISVEYYVTIVVGVTWRKELGIKLNFTMGTVPYLKTYGKHINYRTADDSQSAPKSNIVTGPAPDVRIFGYHYMKPPSYSIAIGQEVNKVSDKDKRDGHEEEYHCPVYTFAKPIYVRKETEFNIPAHY